jgi:hypothetical protein
MSDQVSLLKQAIAIAEEIETLKSRLAVAVRRVPTDSGVGATVAALKKAAGKAGTGRKKPKFSAAGRARIAAAQRRRWAKVRAEKGAAKPSQAAKAAKKPRKRGKLSAAGRAAIVAAQKKRWAKVRKGK